MDSGGSGCKKTRVAIIGCGGIAGGYDETRKKSGVFTHAGAYRKHENIEIAAAYDPDAERLEEFCRFWSVTKACGELYELLGENYDIVSVCAPDQAHAGILAKIIRSGCTKYIWAEKPFTVELAAAREILDLAKAEKISIWLNNQRRFEPVHQRLKKEIARQTIGEIIHVNSYYVKGITHIGVTLIDTLRFLCHEIEWVMAIPPYRTGSYGQDYSLRAAMGLANGATATIIGSDPAGYEYSLFELDILGTKGRIRLVDSGNKAEIYRPGEDPNYAGFKTLRRDDIIETEMPLSMANLFTQLLRAQQERSFSLALAEEAIRDLEVAEAIKTSSGNGGKKVTIPFVKRG